MSRNSSLIRASQRLCAIHELERGCLMRFIPTRIHGAVDYVLGILLMVLPWLFGFTRGGAETWLPVILGAGVVVYSLFTDYEWGAIRSLNVATHLTLDLAGGILLAASPWLFGFDQFVWVPHLVLGILEVGASLFTEVAPRHSTR